MERPAQVGIAVEGPEWHQRCFRCWGCRERRQGTWSRKMKIERRNLWTALTVAMKEIKEQDCNAYLV